MPVDLLTVGEAFEDVIFAGLPRLPRLGEELRSPSLTRHPGGGAVITAVAAARLGLTVGTISAVSPGNAANLRNERISLTNLRRPLEHGAVTVALSTSRDRAFVTYPGVNALLEPRLIAAVRQLRRFPRHVHFALSPKRCNVWVPVVEQVRARGATTSWDFGWSDHLPRDRALNDLLAAVDWVFVNEKEAPLYARVRTMRAALARWPSLARGTVIKLGGKGAMAVTDAGAFRARAFRTRVVDTTGAGDAFNAGFLVALLAEESLNNGLRLGGYVGGRSIRAAGGVDGLPQLRHLPRWARRIAEAV